MEARELGAPSLAPVHFVLGLCKAMEVDVFELVDRNHPDRGNLMEEFLREIRRIRLVFERAGIDPRHERRGIRISLVGSLLGGAPTETHLRRDTDSRTAFRHAEQLATLNGCPVYPIHLLHSLVEQRIELWERQLESNGIQPQSLKKALADDVHHRISTAQGTSPTPRRPDDRTWDQN